MRNCFKKIPFTAVFWIFFYFFIFCLLLKTGFSYLDPDLGWHLRVGEGVAKTMQVPSQNIYNYTYTGTWVDHEWLSNYVVYEINDNLGYPALVIGFALLIVLVLILLNLSVSYLWQKKGKDSPFLLIVILQIFGVVASRPSFGVRIQELALLFLFICLATLYIYNKNKKWPVLLIFIPLLYLWSCLHASFLIGLFITFAWGFVKLFERVALQFKLNKKIFKYFDFSRTISNKELFIYFLVITAAALSVLFTPYRLELLVFLKGYGDTFYVSYISEWLSQFRYPFFYWQLSYLCLGALAFLAYIYKAKKEKISFWTSFIFILFFLMAFKSRRNLPLYFVSTFVFLVYVFSDYIKAGRDKINSLAPWLKIYLIFCLSLTSLSLLVNTNFVRDPFYSKAFAADYPVTALNFISSDKSLDNLRIFNEYSWGGFMIYLNPDKKIFIDGRLPQVYYNGHSFFEEYIEFFSTDSVIESKLKEYKVDLVLTKSQDKKIEAKKWEKFLFYLKDNDLNRKNNLRIYLNNSSDWKAVYSDQTAVIYKRIK